MLNLVMTHSPRMAAVATNKRYGPDIEANPSTRYRVAWLQRSRETAAPMSATDFEPKLRERTA